MRLRYTTRKIRRHHPATKCIDQRPHIGVRRAQRDRDVLECHSSFAKSRIRRTISTASRPSDCAANHSNASVAFSALDSVKSRAASSATPLPWGRFSTKARSRSASSGVRSNAGKIASAREEAPSKARQNRTLAAFASGGSTMSKGSDRRSAQALVASASTVASSASFSCSRIVSYAESNAARSSSSCSGRSTRDGAPTAFDAPLPKTLGIATPRGIGRVEAPRAAIARLVTPRAASRSRRISPEWDRREAAAGAWAPS